MCSGLFRNFSGSESLMEQGVDFIGVFFLSLSGVFINTSTKIFLVGVVGLFSKEFSSLDVFAFLFVSSDCLLWILLVLTDN